MADPNNRYADLPVLHITASGPTGPRRVAYTARRFLPVLDRVHTIVEHTVLQGERLDLIAATYFGDPTQFWRICDANLALNPADLEETGRRVLIGMPMAQE